MCWIGMENQIKRMEKDLYLQTYSLPGSLNAEPIRPSISIESLGFYILYSKPVYQTYLL